VPEAIPAALDRDNVMASNLECCSGLDQWKVRLQRGLEHGTPEDPLQARIFFDRDAIYCERPSADALQDRVTQSVTANTTFQRRMAGTVPRNEPPLGLMRDLAGLYEDRHPLIALNRRMLKVSFRQARKLYQRLSQGLIYELANTPFLSAR
jgi:signal-transduction protein with cAMP-binding, CBS, and nucleotidyltransferase domain